MFVIEQSLMTANITDEVEKLAAITTFVRGTPLSLLRNYIRNNRKPTLQEYFELLESLIPQASRTQYLKNKLMDMKQGHDFEEFFNEFQKMVITIQSRDSSWKESDSVFAFTRALRAKVKFEVEKVEATSLKEAYAIASKYEANVKKIESPKKVQLANTQYRHGKTEHNKVKKKYEQKKSIKCYRCQKDGQIAKDCRVNLEKATTKKPPHNKDTKNNKPKRSYLAKGTSIEGDESEEEEEEETVKIYMAQSNMDILKVKGTVDDIQVEMALETGATVSIMSIETARKHKELYRFCIYFLVHE